jgi:probable phosphoglycerate mutase
LVSTLYLIRHCEAEGNIYRRCHGHYDGMPTLNGIAQCRAVAERFAAIPLTAVYSSDLTRARYTAESIAAQKNLTVRTDPGFREIGLGVWEDRTWGEITRDYAQEYARFADRIWDFRIKGGETAEQVHQRFSRSLQRLLTANTGAAAIVSHGVALRRVISGIMGLDPRAKSPLKHMDNTSVTEISYRSAREPNINYYADNSHLGALSTLAQQNWWREGEKDCELCFDPVVFPRDRSLVAALRKEAWEAVYGSEAYNAEAVLADAERCRKQHNRALVIARSEGKPVGLMQLDTKFKSDEGLGHISLLMLSKAYRGMGLGIQFIGHAVSVYRSLNRHTLHLRVADNNETAIRFYKKLGFEHTGTEEAKIRPLLLMKKSIDPPVWTG